MATHVAGEKPMMKGKSSKGKMEHMRIYHGDNGGHMITHHADEYGPATARHMFSKEEGPEAHDHIEEHMGMCNEGMEEKE